MEKIDTAPKDDTRFLGWSKSGGFNIWVRATDLMGPPHCYCIGGYDMEGEPQPTHWMPLPAEPA